MANNWLNNFTHLIKYGTPGSCPSFRSEDTDHVHVVCSANNNFLEMWCNACGSRNQLCGRGEPPTGFKVMSADEYAYWKCEG